MGTLQRSLLFRTRHYQRNGFVPHCSGRSGSVGICPNFRWDSHQRVKPILLLPPTVRVPILSGCLSTFLRNYARHGIESRQFITNHNSPKAVVGPRSLARVEMRNRRNRFQHSALLQVRSSRNPRLAEIGTTQA
jgi:hypothetical protein